MAVVLASVDPKIQRMAASYIPLETVRGLNRGPLVPHVGAYIERARSEGYPPKTVLVHVQLTASLNRYRGLVHRDWSPVVPHGAKWALAGLPRHLPPGAAAKVLAACDRNRARGRRDYAILLLLSRLGLRGGEVLHLTLDDIDWERGQILVRLRKGPGPARMPLPPDVGRAVAFYLRRDRPRGGSRRVFLRVIAPYEPLSRTAVLSVMVARYMRLAGIGAVRHGAHVFSCGHGVCLLHVSQPLLR